MAFPEPNGFVLLGYKQHMFLSVRPEKWVRLANPGWRAASGSVTGIELVFEDGIRMSLRFEV
jgi:hypothetical protein